MGMVCLARMIAPSRPLWQNSIRTTFRDVLGRGVYYLPLVRMTELGPEEISR